MLVNNAGTAIPKPFEEATQEELDHVIDLNLRGVFIATQAALKHIKKDGRIIMIGFMRGGKRNMTPGLAALRRHEGSRQDVLRKAWPARWGAAASPSIMFSRGPIDTDLNPAASDWAAPQIALTALKTLRTRR